MRLLLWVLPAFLTPPGNDGTPPRKPPARPIPISVREAVSLSLNHNLDIEVARYQPWIEDQNVYAALGTWDHVAYARADGGETVSQGFSTLSGSDRPESDDTSFTVGVRKALPFGPSYDVSWSSSRSLSNSSFLLINPRWTQQLGAAVSVPLLRGASAEANTATLVVARHSKTSSVDAFEKTLGDSVFQVMQAYWDLVFTVEDKKVKEQSLEVATRLLEDNRRKFERGVVARIDVTQADAGVAAQLEGILKAEAAVQNAMDRLKRLVDPALLRQEVLLAPVDAPRGAEAAPEEEALVDRAFTEAMERRPELRQMRLQRRSQELILARARNDLLPRADLTGRAFMNGTDDTFEGAGHEASSGDFRELAVGIVIEWPLEGSAARGAANRAELEQRRLQLQERNLENQVLVEVREAARAIKTNERRIEATRRARILAQEQLEGETTRRDQGLSTTFRVLDVQEDLTQAQTHELKAVIDYGLSWHRLEQVAGTILERNSIVLKENLQPRVAMGNRQ